MSSIENKEVGRIRIGQIQRAAMEVYVEKGIYYAQFGEISKRARISAGIVESCYEDKMDLYRELFLLYMDAANVFIRNLLAQDGEPYEMLENYTMFYLDMAYEQPLLSKFYRKMENDLEIVFSTEMAVIHDKYIQPSHDYLRKTFEKAIKIGQVKAASELKLMMKIYNGALQGAMDFLSEVNMTDEVYEEKKKEMVEWIFNGLT